MILEIIQYTLPVLIVAVIFYLLVRSFLKAEERRRKSKMALDHDRIMVPLRLQAYERLILFLERIPPDALLLRVDYSNMNCRDLQGELLRIIRNEFEHNYTQQLYVSLDAWEKVKMAKDKIVQLINLSTEGTKFNMPAQVLTHNIMEKAMETLKSPAVEAIEYLKREAQEMF
jgi:hypothetical protein